jgi:hypothetical protein
LYADFKVDFEKASLDVVNTTLGEMRIATIAEIATIAGLTRALYNLGTSAVATASEYHMLGQVYGLNTQHLQGMEYAGLAANVSVDKVRQSVLGLQQNLAGLSLGQVNAGFLEAAGFFGLSIQPGTNEKEMMDQIFKKVPQFVKSHGAMGRPMAAQLLSQMGMAPEMLQQIMSGRQSMPGRKMEDPQIEALTRVNESMRVLARNIEFLSYKAIGPLVETLLPISEWFLNSAGGVANLLHPARTVQGLASAFAGAWDEHANYITQDQQKKSAAYLKNLHNAKPLEGMGAFVAQTMLGRPGATEAPVHKSETHISVYGVEDHKIAGAVKRAADTAHERQKRDHAMHTAINNPVGQ